MVGTALRALPYALLSPLVMAGLDPAIHVFATPARRTWMPGTSPGMTE